MNPDESNLPGLEFVDAAVEIANSLETGQRDEIMSAAAVTYSTLGLLDDAIRSADEISDSYLRDTALTQIAVNAVAHEPDADPLTLIESIEDVANQNLALEEIAVKYAGQNLFDQAVEISERLDNRDSALSGIAKIIAKETSLEWSEELARQIDDPNTRTTCLIELARIAGNINQVEQAENILLAAETETEVDGQFINDRVYQLIAIADVYEELNQREKAKEILLRALQLSTEIEGFAGSIEKTFSRDAALAFVVGGFARSRHYDEADRASEQIENPLKFAEGSIAQAIEQHADGNDTQALQMLAEARELITSEPCHEAGSIIVRDYARSQLANAYATLRDFQTGLSEALLISNPETRLTTMLELGWEAAQADFTDSIFEIHDSLADDYTRVKYLVSISDALLKKDNKELAVRLSLRAIEAADKVQRTDQRCRMLIQIASQLIAGELESKVNEILSTVLNTTAKIQDGHKQAEILLAMAEQYQRHARQLSADEKQILESIA